MSARFVLVALALFAGACSGYEGGGDVRIVPLDEVASQEGGAPIVDAGATDAARDARTDTTAPTTSLVAYYPFDADARDRSPAGRDLDVNSGSFSGGHAGQALVITQPGYAAKRPAAEQAFALTNGDFTIQAWISGSTSQAGVGTRALGTAGPGWLLVATQSSVTVATGDPSGSLSTPLPASSAWRHFVVRRSGGTLELFVDGSSSMRKTLGWASSGGAFGAQGSAAGASSRVDEVAIWSRALSDAEIRALAQDTASPKTLP